MATFPPEPWSLRGQLWAAVHLVPAADVPVVVPPGFAVLRLGRRAFVGTAWVSYEPTGVLSYRELMAVVVVRRRLRLAPTITHIWVDSVASRDGGRALWAIPKDLGQFRFDASPDCGAFQAAVDGRAVAVGTSRLRRWLPGRWPVRFRVVQPAAGAARVSPVRATARLGIASADFTACEGGPLEFLAGHRSVLAFVLGDFRMRFGRR